MRDPATGAALAVEAQIVAKEPIAQKAIPNCNITYIDKAEMKSRHFPDTLTYCSTRIPCP